MVVSKDQTLARNEQEYRKDKYIEMLHGGAKIWILFSSSKTTFYERAQWVRKILFLPQENKMHIFNPPCNVLFII